MLLTFPEINTLVSMQWSKSTQLVHLILACYLKNKILSQPLVHQINNVLFVVIFKSKFLTLLLSICIQNAYDRQKYYFWLWIQEKLDI